MCIYMYMYTDHHHHHHHHQRNRHVEIAPRPSCCASSPLRWGPSGTSGGKKRRKCDGKRLGNLGGSWEDVGKDWEENWDVGNW